MTGLDQDASSSGVLVQLLAAAGGLTSKHNPSCPSSPQITDIQPLQWLWTLRQPPRVIHVGSEEAVFTHIPNRGATLPETVVAPVLQSQRNS